MHPPGTLHGATVNGVAITASEAPRPRLGGVDDIQFGARFRAVRLRRRLRQRDVADRAGVSDATVSRLERGRLDLLTVHTIRAVATTLEIRIDLSAWWRGGDLDRLVHSHHATLAEAVIGRLAEIGGWTVRPEISFSIRGERGVIDLLGWHPSTRTLLVIELKTAIVDVGELLGTLDRKARLAATVGRDLGWDPDHVGMCLIVAESPTNRRHVAEFGETLRSALPDDGRTTRRWLRAPAGPLRGLLFFSDRHVVTTGRGIVSRKRVRVPARTPAVRAPSRGTLGRGPEAARSLPNRHLVSR